MRFFNIAADDLEDPRSAALRLAFDPRSDLLISQAAERADANSPPRQPPAPNPGAPSAAPQPLVQPTGGAVAASPQGLQFIKDWERFSNEVYTHDGAHKPTIGWGHLVRPYEHFNYGITEPEADRLFEDEVAKAAKIVSGAVSVPLTQQQKDALVSLAYNNPVAFQKGSSLMTALNSKDYAGAAKAFSNFAAAGGRHSKGLENRRLKEQGIFSDGIYDSRH